VVADKAIAQAERNGQRFYSLSSAILRRRKDYYAILERAQKADRDITDWSCPGWWCRRPLTGLPSPGATRLA